MVEGAVWVMGRGRCASCTGALGWRGFQWGVIGMAQLFAWGVHGGGLPKLGDCKAETSCA
jgi:hypothetical protein